MSLKGFVKRTVKKTKRIINSGKLTDRDKRYFKKAKEGKNLDATVKAASKRFDVKAKDYRTKNNVKTALKGGAIIGTSYAINKGIDNYKEGKTVKGRIKKAYKKVKDKMK